MEPVINKLILKRFRSIPSQTVTFSNPTFLVGHNGAGKSNLVDAFSFLSDAMILPLQAVFDKRGGISSVRNRTSGQGYPPNLGMGVVFGNINGSVESGRYAFEVKALPDYGYEVIREQCLVVTMNGERNWFDRRKKEFSSNIKDLKPSLESSSLGLPVVGGDDRFSPVLKTLSSMRVYSIEPGKLRDFQDPDSGISLKRDGSNAASVLQEIERYSTSDVERIFEILSAIVPNTHKVTTDKHGNKLSMQFIQRWGDDKQLKFEAYNMSDGTLRALGLLMAVYQRPTPSLITIEEPEATIHPGALDAILDLLHIAGKRTQVIVTTHSPDVLNAKWIGDKQLRIVQWAEGATHVTNISASSRKALEQHLMGAGELLRSNALDEPELFKNSDQFETELFPVI